LSYQSSPGCPCDWSNDCASGACLTPNYRCA
jgi:hypothetical protein